VLVQTGTLDVHSCGLVVLPAELARLAGPAIALVDLSGNRLAALTAADLAALCHTRNLRLGGECRFDAWSELLILCRFSICGF
jgi:hypothetical protein